MVDEKRTKSNLDRVKYNIVNNTKAENSHMLRTPKYSSFKLERLNSISPFKRQHDNTMINERADLSGSGSLSRSGSMGDIKVVFWAG